MSISYSRGGGVFKILYDFILFPFGVMFKPLFDENKKKDSYRINNSHFIRDARYIDGSLVLF